MNQLQVFISCEHGGNRVPEKYQPLFSDYAALLETHRGYDIGILSFAELLAAGFNAPLISADVTRLLVDLNRSRGSRTLFSEITRHLPAAEKEKILALYHAPYRRAAEDIVAGILASDLQVLHLSIHSFTPALNGQKRNADVGLLYDPKRAAEKSFCLSWLDALRKSAPLLRIRRNYPYRGNADALVTTLRHKFPAEKYLGVELEINQQLPLEGGKRWSILQEQLLETLRTLIQNIPAQI